MRSTRVAILAGAAALLLMTGALAFQYLANLPPCEMCLWQRWPHIAAIILGLLGGGLVALGVLPKTLAPIFAVVTLLAVALSGALGAYHAGVEWHWWAGPSACTTGFVFNGHLDLTAPVARCDVAAWRFLGISLAGYNALLSLGTALLGTVLLTRRT